MGLLQSQSLSCVHIRMTLAIGLKADARGPICPCVQVSVAQTGFKVTDIQAVSQLICSDVQFVEGEDAVWKEPALEVQVLLVSNAPCTRCI